MKAITRFKFYLPMLALLLTAAPATPAPAQQKQVPYKGTIQGQDEDKGFTSPGIFLVQSTGTGNGIPYGPEIKSAQHIED